jgi:hypothetical protein
MNKNIVEEIYLEIKREQIINDIPHIEQIIFPVTETFSTEEKLNFSQRINNELNYLRTHSSVDAYRPLSNHTNNNIFSSINILIKKIIRKLLKFYIFPIVYDQNNINLRVTNTLELLERILDEKDKQIQELREALNSRDNNRR